MSAPEVWILYDDGDYEINRGFADMLSERCEARGLHALTVLASEILLTMDGRGEPGCLLRGAPARPEAVISRQRDYLVSRHFELMGAKVYNGALACLYCNDKRLTHQLLRGMPMADTVFLPCGVIEPPARLDYPQVVKPADGHGGELVAFAENADEWRAAAKRIDPRPALTQRAVSDAGRDLRAYVLFGQIVAGVMRTAREGIVSNFKLGGDVCLHTLSRAERELAGRVIRRFDEAGAPLCFAGVDMLYEDGEPVVNEVEDVVGSRMLYKVSDIDIADMYIRRIAESLS